ncbi:MAG: hypothetical protein U1E29_05970, partial [Coriobacteriia bacterium]|nr:hypothetical protein [Coriobacteriia bacterium]
LAVVVVVVVGVTAFALGRAGSRNQGAAPAASEPEASQPAESDGAEPLPAGTAPRDVVLAMYEAAARGDEDVVRSTFAFGFNFDPGVLEAWGKPRHEVQLVADGADPAETFVQVLETGGGFSDRDVVTWILREEAGRWRIGGWMLGPLEDFPEITGGTGDPITGLDGAGSDATNLVAEFLQARMGGDVVTMRDLATARLESESPELFITEGPSLIGWRLASVTTEGASRVIWIEESWDYSPNMPEVRLYVVVEQGGGLLVDEYR